MIRKSALQITAVLGLSAGSLAVVSASTAETVSATGSTPTYDVASGGNVLTETFNIAASPDGSVYVAGKYRDTATWGSIQLSSSKEAGYLAKLGPDGVWDWVVDAKDNASCCSSSQVEDVVALDDGSAIFLIDAGFSMGFTNPVTGAAETFSTTGDTSIVARIAADGTFMWFKELHGSPDNPFSLALSADGSTVVAIASHSPSGSSTIQVEAINSATGSSEWLVGNIVFSAGASRASYWPQVAINDSGTAVVSLSYYGGDVVVNGVSYNSKDNNNVDNGAHQTIFVAYDISTSNVEWVSRTRKSATVNVGGSSEATAGFHNLAASGDNFLVLMDVLGGSSDGTVDFADASDTADLSYTTDFDVSSDEDEGPIVVELSDTGDWVEKTRLFYCSTTPNHGCGLSGVYGEKSLHVASDGSFDIFSSATSSATSIAGMDFLGSDDTAFVASFNSDGSSEKLTSFSNCAEPGWYNAIDSFSDGTLVIAGTQECPGPIGDSLGNTATTNTTQWAEFVMPLANGPWVYNTAAGPANTISFDANGGTGAPDPQYCATNEVITLSPVAPTRDGYTFAGWDTGTVDSFGSQIIFQPGDDINCGNGDLTITAMWTQVSYSVTFNPNMGTGQGVYFTCFWGENFVTNNSPDYPGYNFVAWQNRNTLEEHAANVSLPCDGNKNFRALWSADTTDTDGDGVIDSEEETGCENTADCDSDGLTDDLDADDLDSDQDDDSVLDGAEEDSSCITVADCDSDGLTDDLDADDLDSDQDDDSVLDGAEEDSSCITVADCDSDGLTDDLDADDLDSDQDDDSVLDGAEEDSSCVVKADCDDDGLGDALDQDDLDADQDDDGVLDGQDPDQVTSDSDGDGIPDVSEIEGCENTNDCDDDGVLDGDETTGCVVKADCDDDGLGDALDGDDLDADQDDDGVLDGAENDGCVNDPAVGCGAVTDTTVPESAPTTTTTAPAMSTPGSSTTTTTVVLESTIGESTPTSEPLTLPSTGADNRVIPVVMLLLCVGAGLVLLRRRDAFTE